jgi:hypothetical protein
LATNAGLATTNAEQTTENTGLSTRTMDPSNTELTTANMALDTNTEQTKETLSTVEDTDNESPPVLATTIPTAGANLETVTSVQLYGTIRGEESTTSGKAHYYTIINTFLLSEAEPKNVIVNPPPKFGNDCQPRAWARACKVSKFYNFQASLNHRANACSC